MNDNTPSRPLPQTYSECVAELEKILAAMQNDRCDIDNLAAYTRRASELLKACRAKLTATEEELQSVLASLQQQ